VEILKRLREAVRRKRPELLPNDWILHCDSALANKDLPVKQFVTKKPITEKEHPSHSSDLAPNDFWLSPEIKLP
jgi:hypothetical protein